VRITATVKVNHAVARRTVHRQVQPTIRQALFDLRAIFNELFGGIKTGRMYRRPGGGLYQASAPGEPPAIRSGELLRSIGPRSECRPDANRRAICREVGARECKGLGSEAIYQTGNRKTSSAISLIVG
jgi:hypothetical protein